MLNPGRNSARLVKADYASLQRPFDSPLSQKQERAQHKRIYMAQIRLIYATAVFAAAFLAIALRLVDLTIFQETSEIDLRTSVSAPITYGRSNISDRNGMILATSLSTASLYSNPKEILDVDETATKLAQVLPGLSKQSLKAKLSEPKSFVWIKRNLTPEQHYKVHMLGLPGLSFQREERRVYPLGSMYSHVVGLTDLDSKGVSGIEKTFDENLRKGGDALQLSLDTRVQSILHEELKRTVREFNARGAAGLVLDANTGEVIAMVSLPDFDPHEFSKSSQDARFNRITLGVYEMGSTFKIFNTAMALDSGKIKISDSFDATHPIRVGRFVISDYHPENRWMNVAEIFEHSSNIGSAKMALTAGISEQKSFLQRLGLFNPPSIELPELGKPMLPRNWTDVTAMTVSYGYGISVTPLQLARAVAGTVNGGVLPELTLLKRPANTPLPGVRIMSEATSNQMRELLRLVVMKGTGQKADVGGYYVGGKTGTAEKSGAGGYAEKKLLSSFVGTFPTVDPKYVILAMIDEPIANKASFGFATGGWVAAPAVNRVIGRMAPLLGYPPLDRKEDFIAKEHLVQTSPQIRANPLRQEAVYETQ